MNPANLEPEGKMKTKNVFAAALALPSFFLAGTGAQGAAFSSGERSVAVAVTLRGEVNSLIAASVMGSVNRRTSAVTSLAGDGGKAVMDFGGVNIALSPENGERYPVELPDGSLGYYLVGTLRVEAAIAGAGSGAAVSVDLRRANPCGSWPEVPCGNLFFSVAARSSADPLSWDPWVGFPDPQDGVAPFMVPDVSYGPFGGNFFPRLMNGMGIEHQLAVLVDANTPPGPFFADILYTFTLA
jgi:hypothetical protein